MPVQARLILHSWTQPFNQWSSAYFYGTDILVATLFLFWLGRCLAAPNYKLQITNDKQISKSKFQILNLPNFWLGVFFVISAVSIFHSRITGLSFYQLLKLAEFIGFYFYLKSNFGKIFSLRGVLIVMLISGVFQSVIAIIQYVRQGSLGLRLLGESPLSVDAVGVAVFIADSHKYLRAYGTTPHPNILAAWLFLAIFAFYFYYLGRFTDGGAGRLRVLKEALAVIVYGIILFAFFSTFSRVVIGLWFLSLIVRLAVVVFKKDIHQSVFSMRWSLLKLAIATCVVAVVFSLLFWPQVKSRIHVSTQEEAVTQRVFYNKLAGSVIAGSPFLGVGIGQFVPDMMARLKRLPSNAYQPVHNVYLLIAGEVGFSGLAVFVVFLSVVFWSFIKKSDFRDIHSFSFLIVVFSFLIIGFFDHFLWTSQQGSFIFWMVLALLSRPTA